MKSISWSPINLFSVTHFMADLQALWEVKNSSVIFICYSFLGGEGKFFLMAFNHSLHWKINILLESSLKFEHPCVAGFPHFKNCGGADETWKKRGQLDQVVEVDFSVHDYRLSLFTVLSSLSTGAWPGWQLWYSVPVRRPKGSGRSILREPLNFNDKGK